MNTTERLVIQLEIALKRNPGRNVFQVLSEAISTKQATKRLPGLTNTDIYEALKLYNHLKDQDTRKYMSGT